MCRILSKKSGLCDIAKSYSYLCQSAEGPRWPLNPDKACALYHCHIANATQRYSTFNLEWALYTKSKLQLTSNTTPAQTLLLICNVTRLLVLSRLSDNYYSSSSVVHPYAFLKKKSIYQSVFQYRFLPELMFSWVCWNLYQLSPWISLQFISGLSPRVSGWIFFLISNLMCVFFSGRL